MQIIDLLTPERTLFASGITSKKRALERLSEIFANSTNIDSSELFEGFIQRERLGSTAISHGVAIPHIRSAKVHRPLGALMRLSQPLDFDAPDQQPVDLLFGLLIPKAAVEEHLQILAGLAEAFGDKNYCNHLRQATNAQALFQLAVQLHD